MKNVSKITQDVADLNDTLNEIKKKHKRGYNEIQKYINIKEHAWYEGMKKRLNVKEVANANYDAGVALMDKINDQYTNKGAQKRILVSALTKYVNKNFKKQPDIDVAKIAKDLEDKILIPETSAFPTPKPETEPVPPPTPTPSPTAPTAPTAPTGTPTPTGLHTPFGGAPSPTPPTTPSGLPLSPTAGKAKKKTSYVQKMKRWGKAALRMSPVLGTFIDAIEAERSSEKRNEREEEIHQKMLEKGIDPKSSGGKIINKEVINLLKKIEENTRVGGGSGSGKSAGMKIGSNTAIVGRALKAGVRGTVGATDAGRFMLNSYDVIKTVGGAGLEIGGSAVRGTGRLMGWASRGIGSLAKGVGRLGRGLLGSKAAPTPATPIPSWHPTPVTTPTGLHTPFGAPESVTPTPAATTQVGKSKGFGSALSSVARSIMSLNPFKRQSSEDKYEAENAKDKNTELLEKIADNTDEKKKKKEDKGSLFDKLKNTFNSLFGGLLTKLGPMLAETVGPLLLKGLLAFGPHIAVAVATYFAAKALDDWKKANEVKQEARKQKDIAAELNTTAIKESSDAGLAETKDIFNWKKANEKRVQRGIVDDKIEARKFFTQEQADDIWKKFEVKVPPELIKSKAIVADQTQADLATVEANTDPEELQRTAKGKISPAATKLNEVPEVLENNEAIKQALVDKAKEPSKEEKGMTINKSTNTINNNTTALSMRTQPVNQDSSWMRNTRPAY